MKDEFISNIVKGGHLHDYKKFSEIVKARLEEINFKNVPKELKQ
jgi:hypothetical protein